MSHHFDCPFLCLFHHYNIFFEIWQTELHTGFQMWQPPQFVYGTISLGVFFLIDFLISPSMDFAFFIAVTHRHSPILPCTAVQYSQCGVLLYHAILLMQICMVPWRWIKPRKRVRIWQNLLLLNIHFLVLICPSPFPIAPILSTSIHSFPPPFHLPSTCAKLTTKSPRLPPVLSMVAGTPVHHHVNLGSLLLLVVHFHSF